MIQAYYAEKGTDFKGRVILGREFFNPDTKEYIHIEAQETKEEGKFIVAFWVPNGNDGDHGFDGSLRHVIECMNAYTPPPGFVEMAIPVEHYC